jgi:hypothetical protein
LQLAERANVLLIPLESVTQTNEAPTVLVVTAQNTLEERHVKLGLQGKSRVEVLSGLNENDQVVVGNRSQFRNGQKVIPKVVRFRDAENGGAR